MSTTSTQAQPPRAGAQFRLNASRYFHVMGEGWYICTREGVHGPVLQRRDAERWVADMLTAPRAAPSSQAEANSDPWRIGVR